MSKTLTKQSMSNCIDVDLMDLSNMANIIMEYSFQDIRIELIFSEYIHVFHIQKFLQHTSLIKKIINSGIASINIYVEQMNSTHLIFQSNNTSNSDDIINFIQHINQVL